MSTNKTGEMFLKKERVKWKEFEWKTKASLNLNGTYFLWLDPNSSLETMKNISFLKRFF